MDRYLRISRNCIIASTVMLLVGTFLMWLGAISGEPHDMRMGLVVVLAARLPLFGSDWVLRRCREMREAYVDEFRQALDEHWPDEEQEP